MIDTDTANPDASVPLRCVSIDVEEYFHVEAAYEAIGPGRWDDWPTRVVPSVELLLDLFDQHDQKGTFFILGHVAERHPRVPRLIAQRGHEIASHGFNHDRLHRLAPASFREDVDRSKKLLEDQTGRRVIGYRAPTFSVTRQTAWAIDVLVELGFEYDASIFPVLHPLYGVPDAPAEPFTVKTQAGASLLEVPPLTLALGPRKLAVAGGGYFRLLPLWFMNRGLKQAADRRRPAVLYFHPWEFDPGLPRMPLSITGRVRTYTGLDRSAARLARIMAQSARWMSIEHMLGDLKAQASQRSPFVLDA